MVINVQKTINNETTTEFDQGLLMSAEKLALLLDVSVRTLWRLRSAGKLPRPVKIGGCVRWRLAEIRAWIAAGCPHAEKKRN